jgi:two-component system nitrate/nitrite response regulator NarL
LKARPDWETYSERSNGGDAVALAKALNPDLVILDISLPVEHSVEAGRQIIEFCPRAALLAVSLFDPQLFIGDVIEAGLHGFVSKTSIASELIPAIEALLRGGTYFKLSKARRP